MSDPENVDVTVTQSGAGGDAAKPEPEVAQADAGKSVSEQEAPAGGDYTAPGMNVRVEPVDDEPAKPEPAADAAADDAKVAEEKPAAAGSASAAGNPTGVVAEPAGDPRAHWEPDSSRLACAFDGAHAFTVLCRRHHCRECGVIFCDSCSFLRVPTSKVPGSPERACVQCARTLAVNATTVPREDEATEVHGPVDVGVNAEESFENMTIDRGEAVQAVGGQANAKINLTNCRVIGGVTKGSNGHVKLTRCIVEGDIALDITGNNRVELVECVVVGTSRAVRLMANAKLDARSSWFLATDPRGVGFDMGANAKATLEDCVVAGANGFEGKALAMLTMTGTGSIGGRMSAVFGMLNNYAAVQGKHELGSGIRVVGAKRNKVTQPNPLHNALDGKL